MQAARDSTAKLLAAAKLHKPDSAGLLLEQAWLLASGPLPSDDTLVLKAAVELGRNRGNRGMPGQAVEMLAPAFATLQAKHSWSRTDSTLFIKISSSLGNNYSKLGMMDSAMAYLTLSRNLSELLNGPRSRSVCLQLLNQGAYAQNNSNLAAADSLTTLGMEIADELGDFRQMAVARLNLGDIRSSKHPAEAKALLDASLKLLRSHPERNQDALAETLQKLCGLEPDAHRREALFAEALALQLEMNGPGPHRETGKAWMAKGDAELLLGSPREALRCHHQALLHFAPRCNLGDHECNPTLADLDREQLTFLALVGKAKAWQALAETGKALETYHLAFSFWDQMRREMGTLTQQEYHSHQLFPEMDRAMGIALSEYAAQGDHAWLEEVFGFMEMSKANTQLDALDAMHMRQGGGLPDSVVRQGRALSDSVRLLKAQLQLGHSAVAAPLAEARQRLQRHQTWLHSRFPGFYFPEPVRAGWRAAQQEFAQDTTLLLEYYLMDTALLCLAACQGRDTLFVQSWGPYQDSLTLALMHSLSPDQHLPLHPHFTGPAAALFDLLVRPALAICPGHTPPPRMLVVPDGELAFIPFEALLTAPAQAGQRAGTLPYLIRTTTVGYTHSLQLVVRYGSSSQQPSKGKTLGMGSAKQVAPHMSALPNARREAQMAASRMGGTASLDEEATESFFKSHAGGHRILHLATHAVLDTQNSLHSSLLFHPDPVTGEDGRITAYEVYTMQLDADLAVLSACSAGRGRLLRGKGVMSMGMAFNVAGCQNVILTLNDVRDASCYRLMDATYAHLRQGAPVSQALREAKLQFITDKSPSQAHPSQWAPFILHGEGEVRFEPAQDHFWTYAILAILAVVGVVWFRREWR